MALRAARALALALVAAAIASSCLQVSGLGDYTFEPPFRGRLLESTIDKIDLLFVIDNSRDMTEKHNVLRETLGVFISRLINPRCVKPGEDPYQPSAPEKSCAESFRREFAPVRDMHIGVITTSIGGHGADICSGTLRPTENDRAHLVSRRSPDDTSRVPTYQDLGFLAWDPDQKAAPPGEMLIESLQTNLNDIIGGVGADGCGYEAPLEAWYRFLVDPAPYDHVSSDGFVATPVGIDQELLAQRAGFVRPDSLLAIVMLTDENDCSIIDGGQNFLAARFADGYHLPKPRHACATDPNDPCCVSCGQEPPPGCSTAGDDCSGPLPPEADSVNIRCFDQKRRFGIDFLYPIDRYVAGLTGPQITDSAGNVIDNALLAGRNPGRVVLAGIVGVPWQDIARNDETGMPDLETGLDVLGNPIGGVKNAAELLRPVAGYASAWEVMLGDPAQRIAPADTLMVESITPREGVHPLTGDALGDGNGINLGEYPIPDADGLQHACAFFGRDCAGTPECKAGRGRGCTEGSDCQAGLICAPDDRCGEDCTSAAPGHSFACECGDTTTSSLENPLCDDVDGNHTNFQYAEPAYPGTRLLSALRAVGNHGVVGSICPAQLSDPVRPDFGFTPTLEGAIVERLGASLKEHLCLDQSLFPDDDGFAPCVLIEARHEEPGSECAAACASTGRGPASDQHAAAVALARADPDYPTADWTCFCEIEQVSTKADLDACRTYLTDPVVNEFGASVDAWCFVDGMVDPPVGAPELAAGCPADRRRVVRLAGAAEQVPNSRLFLYCD